MNNMQKHMQVRMPDGSLWAVPVQVIAESYSKHYAKDYGGDLDACMKLHTAPLFDSVDDAIYEWAENDMNWSDVAGHAVLVSQGKQVDWQGGWVSGEKKLITLGEQQ